MNTGTSGSVSSITSADAASMAATQTRTATGTMAGEHELGQVPPEVRLAARRRPAPGGRDLAALDAVERSGCDRRRRPTSASRSSDSTVEAARRPATSNHQASMPRAANARASRTRPAATARSDAVEGAGDHRARRVACRSTSTAMPNADRDVEAEEEAHRRARRSNRGSRALITRTG